MNSGNSPTAMNVPEERDHRKLLMGINLPLTVKSGEMLNFILYIFNKYSDKIPKHIPPDSRYILLTRALKDVKDLYIIKYKNHPGKRCTGWS